VLRGSVDEIGNVSPDGAVKDAMAVPVTPAEASMDDLSAQVTVGSFNDESGTPLSSNAKVISAESTNVLEAPQLPWPESASKDGTGAGPNTKFCNLYKTETDDLIKTNSCTNQKLFDKTQCFSRNIDGVTKQFVNWGEIPPPIYCSAIDKGSLVPLSCIDDNSFVRAVDYWVKKYAPQYSNWKEQSIAWGPQWKLNFCSVVQKVNLDKTMKFGELESYKVF
jgi:hypothetical protein